MILVIATMFLRPSGTEQEGDLDQQSNQIRFSRNQRKDQELGDLDQRTLMNHPNTYEPYQHH